MFVVAQFIARSPPIYFPHSALHINHGRPKTDRLDCTWICRLDNAVSNVAGDSGLRIIEAVLGGERDAVKLAELRDFRVEKEKSEIARDLEGDFRAELILVLAEWYDHYRFYNQRMAMAA